VAHVVVGLGNPGPEYQETRHNVGQRVVDLLAERLRGKFERAADTFTTPIRWRGETAYLVKPQSYMNVTGPTVRRALARLGAEPSDLILVYDDIDMELGKVRTRLKGSAGGHNGVRSVIEALGTDEIRRVKLGIGRPEHKGDVPDHVLTLFEEDERPVVDAAVAVAADRVQDMMSGRR
jgi:PTH1 family peptidyl-tRNA hydrolase